VQAWESLAQACSAVNRAQCAAADHGAQQLPRRRELRRHICREIGGSIKWKLIGRCDQRGVNRKNKPATGTHQIQFVLFKIRSSQIQVFSISFTKSQPCSHYHLRASATFNIAIRGDGHRPLAQPTVSRFFEISISQNGSPRVWLAAGRPSMVSPGSKSASPGNRDFLLPYFFAHWPERRHQDVDLRRPTVAVPGGGHHPLHDSSEPDGVGVAQPCWVSIALIGCWGIGFVAGGQRHKPLPGHRGSPPAMAQQLPWKSHRPVHLPVLVLASLDGRARSLPAIRGNKLQRVCRQGIPAGVDRRRRPSRSAYFKPACGNAVLVET